MPRVPARFGVAATLLFTFVSVSACTPGEASATVPTTGTPGTGTLEATFQMPSDGVSLTSPVRMSVTGEGVEGAYFQVDGVLVHQDDEAPFEFEFVPGDYDDGEHLVLAVAYAGEDEAQRAVRVNVGDEPPAPIPAPVDLDDLEPNTWVRLDPQVVLPSPYTDGRVGRPTWGEFIYMPDDGKVVVGGLYKDDHLGGGREYAIYDNSMYSWDVKANTYSLIMVTSWLGASFGQHEEEGKEGETPVNRHLYSGLAYVPETREIHWVGGCNARTQGLDLSTTWAYSVDEGTWRRTGTIPGMTLYNGHAVYASTARTIYYMVNRQVFAYDTVADNGWELVMESSAPHQFYASSSTYDSARNRIMFFDDGKNDENNRDIVAFDVATQTFSTIADDSPAPYGMITYHSGEDVYIVVGRQNPQTWYFDPVSGDWHLHATTGQPEPAPTGSHYDYIAYDEKNDVVVVDPVFRAAMRFRR